MKSENLNIVIVTYNNRELLRKCIESVEASRKNIDLDSIITVVDNASTDGTEEEIRRNFPEINYIKNDKNYGLAKALNMGIKSSIASDFTLLLNDDVELFDDTIKRMLDVLEEHPEASGVPARLVYPDGSPQRIKLNIIGINKKLKDGITYVKFAGTTASLYRTEIFKKIGFFDEFYFFYNEDLDFCLRAKRAGFRFVFDPEIKVIHHRKKGRQKAEIEIKPYFYATDYYFYRKNYGLLFAGVYRLMAEFHMRLWRHRFGKAGNVEKLNILDQGREMLYETIKGFRKGIFMKRYGT